MARVTLNNITHPLPQPLLVDYCVSFTSRLKGLMFQSMITPFEGILMVQETENRMNAAIHMFFMNFDIAVIWLDHQLHVVDIKIAHPWQPMLTPRIPAKYILETHPDRFSNFTLGDQIEIISA